MIKSNFRKHIGYYIAFSAVQLLGLFLIILVAGDKQLQLIVVFATTLFYFTFAVVHHLLDHDLTSKIVLEYALMGCFGLAVYMLFGANL